VIEKNYLSGQSATSGTGRRRAPRLPVDLAGTLAGRSRRAVRVVDLSLTGCLVRCDTAYDHGAILDLSIALDPEPLRAKARVTESYLEGGASPGTPARHLCGLEFLRLPPREETRLRRFLDEERRRRHGADAAAR
jgi:hypothetical protein